MLLFLHVSGILEKIFFFCVCQVCLKRNVFLSVSGMLEKKCFLPVSGMLQKKCFFAICQVCLKRNVVFFCFFACIRYA